MEAHGAGLDSSELLFAVRTTKYREPSMTKRTAKLMLRRKPNMRQRSLKATCMPSPRIAQDRASTSSSPTLSQFVEGGYWILRRWQLCSEVLDLIKSTHSPQLQVVTLRVSSANAGRKPVLIY